MRAPYLRVIAFFTVTALASLFMVLTLSEYRGGGSPTKYRAVLANASFLSSGDAVRIAGVDVGTVDGLHYQSDGTIRIDFHVNGDRPLPSGVRAAIRYKNLVGDRVLTLEQGPRTSGILPAGATIPLTRTDPALSLDELTGGFRPLLQVLDPGEVNQLSANLIALVQGESTAVGTLLQTVADVTSTLADRKVVVDRLITNLSSTVGAVGDHSVELDQIVGSLQGLVSELNRKRDPVLKAAANIAGFSGELADLLGAVRPDLSASVKDIGAVSRTLQAHAQEVDDFLENLGPAYDAIAGIGVYGDFFNFYLCDVRVKTSGLGGSAIYTPWVQSNVPRCNGKKSGS